MRTALAAFLSGVVLCACEGDPGPAVIAFALPDWERNVVIVARDGIARTARPGDPEIRIVWDSVGLDETSGAALGSMYVVQFWDPARPDTVSRRYVERYRALTGEQPRAPNAMRHGALMAVVAAIREVGSDRAKVTAWLGSLDRTRPPLAGVTGPVSFASGAPARLQIVGPSELPGASVPEEQP